MLHQRGQRRVRHSQTNGGLNVRIRARCPCRLRTYLDRERALGLRGLEGEAAATYFAVFDHLIRSGDPVMHFGSRSRRPPLDRVNALLSFFYAMLGHDCRSALEAHGLDPQVGFLHVDRLGLSLINRGQVQAKDFVVEEAGGVRLTDDARKAVLVAWQERKRDELKHPFLGEAPLLGLVAHLQAQLLARHLRGDLDGYPGFFWK